MSVTVGPRIRALREAGGLSLRDLADRTGVSAPMLSQVERGETSPTLATAGRIAKGLELSLSQLLRLDEGGAVAAAVARRAQPAQAEGRRRHRRAGRPAEPRARRPRDRPRRAGHDRPAHRRRAP
jgi:XRE family transcriptional regulator, regulator of sulfur utilization